MGVYIHTDEWLPTSTTVAYYPLTTISTVNDQSGNNRNLTNNWATFWTYGWADCMRLNSSSSYLQWNIWDISQYSHTISIWAYKTWWGGGYPLTQRWLWDSNHKWWVELIQRSSNYIRYAFWFDDLDSPNNYSTWAWHNVVLQYNKSSNSQIMYIDWTKVGERSCTYTHTIYSTTNFVIGKDVPLSSSEYWNGYLSNYIVESKLRTAQEIANYYNSTKSNYWL